MYNEKLKSKFIQSYTTNLNTANTCMRLFDSFEIYEETFGKDLCTLNSDELKLVIEKVLGLRRSTIYTQLIILREYVRWCVLIKVPDACSDIFDVDVMGLEKIRTQMVASPIQLQAYLDNICDPEDMCTVDNVIRCYYWLVYWGVKEEDALSFKCSDVNLYDMIIYYNNTLLRMDSLALKAFKICVNSDSFVYNHPNYTISRPRVPGDTITRGIRGTLTIKSLRMELSRRSAKSISEGKTDLKLSYYRVRTSGLFYRVHNDELLGYKPNFDKFAREHVRERYPELRDEGEITARANRVSRDYLHDYNRWKLAFQV